MTEDQVKTALPQKAIIQKNSKTFSWASLFFSSEQKTGAWNLYCWCRFVDDEIDQTKCSDGRNEKLADIRAKTRAAFSRPDSLLAEQDLPYQSLALLNKEFSLPEKYPLDLLRGMEFDSLGRRPQDETELSEYCYYVAGTVGLMMCSVTGVSSSAALDHAKSLGEAMQLSNICRDLWEDHNNDRNYIPMNWLRDTGLDEKSLWEPENSAVLLGLRQRLASLAESHYRHAFAGLKYLSFRSAWAVVIAGYAYREISRKAVRLGVKSLHRRTVVSGWEKGLCFIRATALLMGQRLSQGPRWNWRSA